MQLTFRNVSEALPILMWEVMNNGRDTPSRNGLTKELTHVHIELTHPLERVITVLGRGHSAIAQVAETMWVLAGRQDVDWLGHYLPRAREFSDDGKVWRAGYGARLRHFGNYGADGFVHMERFGVDQLKAVVDLLKAEPNTRRAVMSIWDPEVDTLPGKDIPCNNWLHFLPRDGRLDLHVAVRSNDLMWGWSGINHYEWSVLLEVVAALTGMTVGGLHFSISSLHLYERHFEKANQLAQASPRGQAGQPRFRATDLRQLDTLLTSWFRLEKQLRFNEPVNRGAIDGFPDPLLGFWLQMVENYWIDKRQQDHFADRLAELHNAKHRAYGDSWMKRGEVFSILPNIARKMDRLVSGLDTPDETQADTAADLLVYLAKYRCWLTQHAGAAAPAGVPWRACDDPTGRPEAANQLIKAVRPVTGCDSGVLIARIESGVNALLTDLETVRLMDRAGMVDSLLPLASALARQYDRG